jgi:hypothetical protein
MAENGTIPEDCLEFTCDEQVEVEVTAVDYTVPHLPIDVLPTLMVAAMAALNLGYHVFLFTFNNFHTSVNAWKWTTFYNAGYNTMVILQVITKSIQLVSWPLAYIWEGFAWWYFTWTSIVAGVDITIVFIPLIFWLSSVLKDGNALTGDFLWQFMVEWLIVIGQILWNFKWVDGLADWFYFNVKGYLEDGWCNPKYQDCELLDQEA